MEELNYILDESLPEGFRKFAEEYLSLMDEVSSRAFSEAYRRYRAAHPDDTSLDKNVARLSALIAEKTGTKVRLAPGTRTGNRPGRKPKAATEKASKPGETTAPTSSKVAMPVAVTPTAATADSRMEIKVSFPTETGIIDLTLPYPMGKKDVERMKQFLDLLYA